MQKSYTPIIKTIPSYSSYDTASIFHQSTNLIQETSLRTFKKKTNLEVHGKKLEA